jgi:hypothetical protein
MAKYMNVDTDDRDIVRVIHDMTRQGKTMEQMRPIIGMPYDVIDRHRKAAQVEMAKKKKKKNKPGY